jgi:hypothetical protein
MGATSRFLSQRKNQRKTVFFFLGCQEKNQLVFWSRSRREESHHVSVIIREKKGKQKGKNSLSLVG